MNARNMRNYSVIPILAALVGIGMAWTYSARAQCVSLPSGAVAWWKADGNTNDRVGGNRADLQEGATLVPGHVGGAFYFDGGNDFVSMSETGTLDTITTATTVECWVRADALPVGYTYFYARRHPMNVEGFSVGMTSDGKVFVVVATTTMVRGYESAPGVVTLGQFHHIAVTASTVTGEVKAYVDGAEVVLPGPPLTGNFLNLEILYLGRRQSPHLGEGAAGAGHLQGLMDEVTVYNRVLSAPEILGIYSAGTAGKCVPDCDVSSSLRNWWRLENSTADAVGASTLTLGNGAAFADGQCGRAIAFDGDDDYAGVSGAFHDAIESTFEAWIHPLVQPHDQWVWGKRSPLASEGFSVWVTPDGRLGAAVGTSAATSRFMSPPSRIAFGQFQHIAVTISTLSGRVTGYVNGEEAGLVVVNGPAALSGFLSSGTGTGFGQRQPNGYEGVAAGAHFRGWIDEPTFHGRALTIAEVRAILAAGCGNKCAATPAALTQPANQTLLCVSPAGVETTVDVEAFAFLGRPATVNWRVNGNEVQTDSIAGQGASRGIGLALTRTYPPGNHTVEITIDVGVGPADTSSMTVAANAAACAPLPTGAIAWWRADGTADDFVGNHHGSLWNGVTFGTGVVGQAFSCDGANDYVSVADSPAMRPTSLTIEGLFNFSNLTGLRHLVSKPVGGGPRDSFGIYYHNGTLVAFVGTDSTNSVIIHPWSPMVGQWYHIALTFDDDANAQNLYLDGALVGSASTTLSLGYDNHALMIGAEIENGGLAFFFQGQIDEVGFYNRAMSSGEVQSVFAAGCAGKCIVPDTDNDGYPDDADNCPTIANADQLDFDNDTIGDACDPDDDNDGLSDEDEAAYGSNPFDTDTDDDGLNDGDEVHTHTTNPTDMDTDDDGLTDGEEINLQTFGNCPSPLLEDTDDDGLNDYIETVIIPALDPCDADCDDDGLADGVEDQLGTGLCDADTDDDGLFDGTEVDMGCLSPFVADTDGDTLSDGNEVQLGYNPCNPDTDGDGARDDVDPSPLVPGVSSGFIEDWLRETATDVDATDLAFFDAPNNNAKQGRRNAISNKLATAANLTAQGNYQAAINELQSLREKLDGDPQPPDWMIPSLERDQLVIDIDLAISWLAYLIP